MEGGYDDLSNRSCPYLLSQSVQLVLVTLFAAFVLCLHIVIITESNFEFTLKWKMHLYKKRLSIQSTNVGIKLHCQVYCVSLMNRSSSLYTGAVNCHSLPLLEVRFISDNEYQTTHGGWSQRKCSFVQQTEDCDSRQRKDRRIKSPLHTPLRGLCKSDTACMWRMLTTAAARETGFLV